MKHFVIYTIAFVLSSTSYSQGTLNKEFSLQGKIIGQDTGYVHIGYLNSLKKYIDDSSYLKNGEFEFSGLMDEPTIARFYGNIKSRSIDDSNFTEIYLEPNLMQAIFKVDNFKNAKVTGSKTQVEYTIYRGRNDSLHNKWKKMFDELDEARAKIDTAKIEKIYNEQMPVYAKESENIDWSFIKQSPNSFVSANILFYKTQILPLDSLKLFYALLSNNVQKSRDGKRIKDFIQKAEKLAIGMQAPDFMQTDLNGRSISLRDFRGKYVLLDFWASWCIPCREENPYLKQAYSKYQGRFTIIGFSLDRLEDKNAWIDAIKKDDVPWIQVCDFKVWNGKVVNEYNLFGKGIPSNFLINPQGKIVAKDLRGDSVEKKLAEFIN